MFSATDCVLLGIAGCVACTILVRLVGIEWRNRQAAQAATSSPRESASGKGDKRTAKLTGGPGAAGRRPL